MLAGQIVLDVAMCVSFFITLRRLENNGQLFRGLNTDFKSVIKLAFFVITYVFLRALTINIGMYLRIGLALILYTILITFTEKKVSIKYVLFSFTMKYFLFVISGLITAQILLVSEVFGVTISYHLLQDIIMVVVFATYLSPSATKRLKLHELIASLNISYVRNVAIICAIVLSILFHFLFGVAELDFANDLRFSQLITFLSTVVLLSTVFFFCGAHKFAKQEKTEQENTLKYTKQIEKQYSEIREFKHDYHNILKSMTSYLMENNYEGLHDYYFKNILKTSQALDNHNFDFEPIHHMKVSQIKGIILSKLLEAIDLGISIELEAKEPIESVQIDSNILIRALGILLDNAIEELQSIGQGKLNVTFYPNDADVVIIVSNTCRERIESIQKLKTKNFSTKGENRGLGLSSLDKFRAKHKNLNVHTKIEENTFIQKITIKGV